VGHGLEADYGPEWAVVPGFFNASSKMSLPRVRGLRGGSLGQYMEPMSTQFRN
jgi:hypothetical protein